MFARFKVANVEKKGITYFLNMVWSIEAVMFSLKLWHYWLFINRCINASLGLAGSSWQNAPSALFILTFHDQLTSSWHDRCACMFVKCLVYVCYLCTLVVCTHVKTLYRILPMDDLTEPASVTHVKFVINGALVNWRLHAIEDNDT